MEKKVAKNKSNSQSNKKEGSLPKSSFKKYMGNYFKFYKTNLMRKHIIIYVLCLVLFAILLSLFINNISTSNALNDQITNLDKVTSIKDTNIFSLIVKEKIPLVLVVIFAGITPFLYIPILAVFGASYILAYDIGVIIHNSTGGTSILGVTISSVLQLIGISLAAATGVYYCYMNTKKYRYSQIRSFGFNDVKARFYQMKKDDINYQNTIDKKNKKIEKNEKLNVKIDYVNMLISTVVAVMVVTLSTLIVLI
ncbi:MAG: hypothetical protein N2749_04845 [Clostridia bacterium]|nr:hypothetical protein [Clostridia bacterium]